MLCATLLAFAAAPAPGKDGVAFFEAKIRPVLVQHCYPCHSAEAAKTKKLRGGLLLDTRAGIRKGGDSGPAVVPGKPDDSLARQGAAPRRRSARCRPRASCPTRSIADFAKWIDDGRRRPARRQPCCRPSGPSTSTQGKQFWSFRPLAAATPPAVKNAAWVRNADRPLHPRRPGGEGPRAEPAALAGEAHPPGRRST